MKREATAKRLWVDHMQQGGILTLKYILDNVGFESHEDMIRIQEFLRDLEMER
jgi:hypothetical protein